MLLVDDDNAEFAERQKHRRAHADHHTRLIAVEQFFPNVDTLVVGKFGMVD